jgi:hypothetical protein
MIDHAVNDGLEAITDSESVWLSFLASEMSRPMLKLV